LPIISESLETGEVKFYISQSDAKKDGFDSRRVSECINGNRARYKKHLFRMASESEIKYYKEP